MSIKRTPFMDRLLFHLPLVFLVLISCSTPQNKQFEYRRDKTTWDRYRPADLQVIIDSKPEFADLSDNIRMNINAIAAHEPYRVKVKYLDNVREISKEKKELITLWGKGLQVEKEIINLYGHEILFQHAATSFWFPVQSPLVQDFKREIERGNDVSLYVMFVGTVFESGLVQWVFVVNEFQKVKQ
jgi:hypothetical protein